MGKIGRINRQEKPVFIPDGDKVRVLMENDTYGEAIDPGKLYPWLDENMDLISWQVCVAISKAEQARVGR